MQLQAYKIIEHLGIPKHLIDHFQAYHQKYLINSRHTTTTNGYFHGNINKFHSSVLDILIDTYPSSCWFICQYKTCCDYCLSKIFAGSDAEIPSSVVGGLAVENPSSVVDNHGSIVRNPGWSVVGVSDDSVVRNPDFVVIVFGSIVRIFGLVVNPTSGPIKK